MELGLQSQQSQQSQQNQIGQQNNLLKNHVAPGIQTLLHLRFHLHVQIAHGSVHPGQATDDQSCCALGTGCRTQGKAQKSPLEQTIGHSVICPGFLSGPLSALGEVLGSDFDQATKGLYLRLVLRCGTPEQAQHQAQSKDRQQQVPKRLFSTHSQVGI